MEYWSNAWLMIKSEGFAPEFGKFQRVGKGRLRLYLAVLIIIDKRIFVLNGDIRIQAYQTPEKKAEEITVKKFFYVEHPPMSILGIANGNVTTDGCVWLQVTYGKGTAINNVPIEAPNYIY